MKVWLLSSELPDFVGGGIARYIDNFARAWAHSGHEITVICRGEKEATVEIASGYRQVRFVPRYAKLHEGSAALPADQHPAYPYQVIGYMPAYSYELAERLETLAQEEGLPDVIETQEYLGIAYYAMQRQLKDPAYLPGAPFLVHCHSPDFLLRRLNHEPAYDFPVYLYGMMEKFCLGAADGLLCPSQFLARELAPLLPDDQPAPTVIPLPLGASDETAVLPGKPAEALYFGRLELRKGVLELLDACRQMWRNGHDFLLKLAGSDTPYPARGCTMQTYIEQRYKDELREGRIQLLGTLKHATMQSLLQESGLVVIPSLWENFPNTCIEAMAAGCVVLASTSGGQKEMIGHDGQAGLLFDWEQPESFTTQMTRALQLGTDERVAIGQAARARIRQLCDPARVVDLRLERFQQVIKERSDRTLYPFLNTPQRQGKLSVQALTDTKAGQVTMVVPYYNMGPYIEETLASLFAIEYAHYDILIVNDGSTDLQSLQRLDAYRGHERVTVLDCANGGLASARNRGAQAAQGEYICLVDADDQLEPAFVSKAIAVLERYRNVHIVYSWERYYEESQDIYPGWDMELPYLLAHNVTAPLAVVRRDAFLAHGQNPPRYQYNFEDYAGWLSMVAAGCGGVCLHEPLVRYRIRRDSLWQGSGRPQHLHLYNLLVEDFRELYQTYGDELFCLQNANGPAQAWLHPAHESPYDAGLRWHGEERARLLQRIQELETSLQQAQNKPAPNALPHWLRRFLGNR